MPSWLPLVFSSVCLAVLGIAATRWRTPSARARLHALLLMFMGAMFLLQGLQSFVRSEQREAERMALLLKLRNVELPPGIEGDLLAREGHGLRLVLPLAGAFLLSAGLARLAPLSRPS